MFLFDNYEKLHLELVSSTRLSGMSNYIIKNYHSYVNKTQSVGRRIDWLIYYKNEIIGMIGVGSSVYPPPKDLLNYVGLSKSEYADKFNTFANNWRFCLTKSIKNIGSQTLKHLRTKAPIEWEKKYGDKLEYILTFVGGGNNGAVYLADNWELIGETAGLPEHKSSSMKWDNGEQLSEKFVKPTGENKKLILIKKLAKNRK